MLTALAASGHLEYDALLCFLAFPLPPTFVLQYQRVGATLATHSVRYDSITVLLLVCPKIYCFHRARTRSKRP